METYSDQLDRTRKHYPFAKWELGSQPKLYTHENCEAAKSIVDDLISDLVDIGEDASERAKLEKFEKAVVALNNLNEELGLIETGEQEQLCALFNQIAIQAGIDPKKYGDGEGPASEWREW